MKRHLTIAVLLLAMFPVGAALGDDAYFAVELRDLELTAGKLPEPPLLFDRGRTRFMLPYAVADGGTEALVHGDVLPWIPGMDVVDLKLCARGPAGKDVTGRLYLRKTDSSGMTGVSFRIAADKANAKHRDAFLKERLARYQRLAARDIAGGAWFRHQARLAEKALSPVAKPDADDRRPNLPRNESELEETFALFTGGRALSENLQLDRTLLPTTAGEETVPVEKIDGISVAEIDWSQLLASKNPALDPLAALVPADQHVVLFPSFAAAVRIVDEVNEAGTPVLQLAEPRSEDARTVDRYQAQLGVSLGTAARILGPQVVQSVALTGSDPNFRTGTDVAVLFETRQPDVLQNLLLAQIKLSSAATPGAAPQQGEIGGLSYRGVRSPDRAISAYVATLAGAVVLTNSPYQLQRLADAAAGRTPALASLPEFKFFRDRYPLGAKDETALVFLSDATIRRWCGPRWRIAASRRTRDMAVIAELQAGQFDKLVAGTAKSGEIDTDLPLANVGAVTVGSGGVRSDVYNSLVFETPIAELPLARVTAAEAQGYGQWRDRYQSNWRWAFDPVAIRITAEDKRLAVDLSVIPLIFGSDYRQFISLTQGAKLNAGAGDLHGAFAHWVLAINKKSPILQQWNAMAGMLAPGHNVDVLGWLGNSVALYYDDDPFWAEAAKLPFEQLGQEMHRMPVAVRADIASPIKAAAFLTALRAFIEQAAPNLTVWESFKYRDQAYTRVRSAAGRGAGPEFEKLAIHYTVAGDAIVATPNLDVLKRAIDRQLDREKAAQDKPAAAAAGPAPLGDNLVMHVDRKAVEVFSGVGRDNYQMHMQSLAWSNLPILNEWKRMYPDLDPVELHERFWHTRLVCPGGGKYAWNESFQTMESTVYGHPGESKSGPPVSTQLAEFRRGSFGLTFEHQGLRARVELEREKPPRQLWPDVRASRKT